MKIYTHNTTSCVFVKRKNKKTLEKTDFIRFFASFFTAKNISPLFCPFLEEIRKRIVFNFLLGFTQARLSTRQPLFFFVALPALHDWHNGILSQYYRAELDTAIQNRNNRHRATWTHTYACNCEV